MRSLCKIKNYSRRIVAFTLVLVMTAAMVLTILPSENADAAVSSKKPLKLTFAHAYDVQRSPAYPTKDQTCRVSGFKLPYIAGRNGQYESSDGTFVLEAEGLYSSSKSYMGKTDDTDYSTNVRSLVASIARLYKTSNEAIAVFSLYVDVGNGLIWDGYGVLCALDKAGENALYVSANGDLGWYLSDTDCSGLTELNFVVEMDASTGFEYDPDKLNYDIESLNNLEDTSDPSYAPKKRVSGDYDESTNPSASANLHVYLNDVGDRITVYKIADMTYDADNATYNGPNWLTSVDAWRQSIDTYNTTAYSSVDKMDGLSSTDLASFYAAMELEIKKESSAISLTPVIEDAAYDKSEDDKGYSVNTGLTNLSFGTYLILGSNTGGDTYAPTVVNVVPYKNGPFMNYYIEYDIYAYLKSVSASVDKTINGHDASDTVEIGELVDFDIDITAPNYKATTVLTSSSPSDYDFKAIDAYKLYAEDSMSDAFALVAKDGSAISDSTSDTDIFDIIATYSDGADEKEWTIPSGEIEYYEIADATYFDNHSVDAANKTEEVTSGNKPAYTYDKNNTYLPSSYYGVKVKAPIYEIVQNPADDSTVSFRVYINRSALLAQLAANNGTDAPKSITGINIRYKARVTSKCNANSDDNSNTVKLHYAGEQNGVGAEDSVFAYTYALQIIKLDGDSDDSLAGAEFKLYKEAYTYSVTLDSNGNVETANWLGGVDGKESLPTEITSDGNYSAGDEGLSVFDANSDYYVYIWKAPNGGTDTDGEFVTFTKAQDDGDAKVPYTKGSTYARVFKLYTNDYIDTYKNAEMDSALDKFAGTLTSSSDEAGTKLVGIKEGNYILVESKTPAGYNELAEDLYFEINRLTDEYAKQNYNSALIAFMDQDGNIDTGYPDGPYDGVVTLKVLNYRGLTLPSTGGIGTTIFIILGLLIMGTSVIIIIVKRRKMTE